MRGEDRARQDDPTTPLNIPTPFQILTDEIRG